MSSKKFLSSLCFILVALLAFPLTAQMASADEETNIFTVAGIRYRIINNTNTVEVINPTSDGLSASTYSGDFKVPASVNNEGTDYAVVGIDANAFIDAALSSIELPEGLEYIDNWAFANSTLPSIKIPSSVTTLGYDSPVFTGNKKVPSLSKIEFAEGSKLTTIGKNALAYCNNVETIKLPASVTDLNLDNIVTKSSNGQPTGEKDLGSLNSWANAKNITFAEGSPFENVDGVLYKGDTCIVALDDQISSLKVREGTTQIGDGAFYLCQNLATIELPDGLKTIGNQAFNFAPLVELDLPPFVPQTPASTPANILTQINIPASVTTIGDNFLKGAVKTDGSSLIIMQGSTPPTMGSGALINGKKTDEPAKAVIITPEDAKDAYTNDSYPLSSFVKDSIANAGAESKVEFKLELPTTMNLTVNNTAKLEGSITVPENAKLNWTSDNESVVTVNENDELVAKGVGTANVKAEITLNGIKLASATCAVTVNAETVPATSITLDQTTLYLYSNTSANTATLTATVEPGDTTDVISWSSSDPTVATVDANGLVTAVADGTATITATAGTQKATCTVTVSTYNPPAPTRYNITVADSAGGTVDASASAAVSGKKITLTVTPDDGYHLDELTVTDRRGREIDVTDNGDSTYIFRMPASKVTITAIFAKDEAPAPEPTPELPFTDVAEGAWYYDAVQYVYGEGLMTGTSDTLFSPELTTTRGMIVSILHRLEGSPVVKVDSFDDVADGAWYAQAVAWAADNGIVSGYSDTAFGPNDPITREQLAAILYNYAEFKGMDVSSRADLSKYVDAANISIWAKDVLSWANAEGLVNGMTETTLNPQGNATRAQVAAIFERFLTK